MLSLLARLLLSAFIFGVFAGAEMVAGAAEPLKYQFSMTLPDFVSPTGVKLRDLPASMEWSPDSRRLAVVGFNSGKVHLIDVERQQLIHSDISWTLNPPRIVWSPDSSVLAVIGIDLVLFSAADGKEIKRTKIQYGQCTARPRRPGAFTPDGRFLWVSCGAKQQSATYRAANMFSVPDLEIVDTVDAAVPVPGSFNSTLNNRIIVADGKFLLTSFFLVCFRPTAESRSLTCYHSVTCIDLNAKKPCFAPFELDRAAIGRGGMDFQVDFAKGWVVSRWLSKESVRYGPSDWAFAIHDFNGRQIRQFGAPRELSKVEVHDFAITSDGVVIGALDDSDRNIGGLRVWIGESGELRQSLSTPAASPLELSRDGRRLAVIMGKELRVYSVS